MLTPERTARRRPRAWRRAASEEERGLREGFVGCRRSRRRRVGAAPGAAGGGRSWRWCAEVRRAVWKVIGVPRGTRGARLRTVWRDRGGGGGMVNVNDDAGGVRICAVARRSQI